jgi:hypothetical protein
MTRSNIVFVVATLVLSMAVALGHSSGQVMKKRGANNSPSKQRGTPAKKPAAKAPGGRAAAPARTRPVRTPVDLSDPKACLYELAELASFGLKFNDFYDYRANAVGINGVDTMEQIDRTVRFDRLLKSNDPKFRALVEKVRRISLDVWRTARANRDYGVVGKGNLEVRAGAKALAYETRRMLEENSARQAATRLVRTPLGVRPEVDQDRFHQLLSPYLGAQVREQALNEIEQLRKTSRLMTSLQYLLEDQMAQLWREELLPELKKDSGPATDMALLELGQPESLPVLKDERAARASLIDEKPTTILIRNTSGQTLHHVTLEVKLENNLGDQRWWYAYFPVLEPSQYVLNASFNYPWGIDWYSDRIEATVSLFCSEGSVIERKVERSPQIVKSYASHRKTNLLEGLETREDVLTGMHDTQTRAPGVLRLLRETYPPPRNPEAMRAQVASRIKPGNRYRSQVDRNKTVSILFQALDDRPSSIRAEATIRVNLAAYRGPQAAPKVTTYPMLGRFVEEVDRGCVIALVPARTNLEQHEEDALERRKSSMMDPDPVKRRRAEQIYNQMLARIQRLKKETGEDREQSWERREIVVLTSPFEIRQRTTTIQWEVPQASKRTESASYVVFIDKQGQLSLQSTPDEVTHLPLVQE